MAPPEEQPEEQIVGRPLPTDVPQTQLQQQEMAANWLQAPQPRRWQPVDQTMLRQQHYRSRVVTVVARNVHAMAIVLEVKASRLVLMPKVIVRRDARVLIIDEQLCFRGRELDGTTTLRE